MGFKARAVEGVVVEGAVPLFGGEGVGGGPGRGLVVVVIGHCNYGAVRRVFQMVGIGVMKLCIIGEGRDSV